MGQGTCKTPVGVRPSAECELFMTKAMGEVKECIAEGFRSVDLRLQAIEATVAWHGEAIEDLTKRFDSLINGNGTMGHKQLATEWTAHKKVHQDSKQSTATFVTKVVVGLLLVTWQVFLGVALAKLHTGV